VSKQLAHGCYPVNPGPLGPKARTLTIMPLSLRLMTNVNILNFWQYARVARLQDRVRRSVNQCTFRVPAGCVNAFNYSFFPTTVWICNQLLADVVMSPSIGAYKNGKMVSGSRCYRALESVSIASALSTALTIYPCQIRVYQRWQSKLQLPTAQKKERRPATADSSPHAVTCQHCDTHYFSRPRTHNLQVLDDRQ